MRHVVSTVRNLRQWEPDREISLLASNVVTSPVGENNPGVVAVNGAIARDGNLINFESPVSNESQAAIARSIGRRTPGAPATSVDQPRDQRADQPLPINNRPVIGHHAQGATCPSWVPHAGFFEGPPRGAANNVTTNRLRGNIPPPLHVRMPEANSAAPPPPRLNQQAPAQSSNTIAQGIRVEANRLQEAESRRHQSAQANRLNQYCSHVESLCQELKVLVMVVEQMKKGTNWKALAYNRERIRHAEGRSRELAQLWTDYVDGVEDPAVLAREAPRGVRDAKMIDQLLRKICETMGTVESDMSATPEASFHSSGGGVKATHLEKLSIPTFTGEHLDFPQFKQTFQSLIRPNNLEDPVALQYLKKALPKSCHHLLRGASSMEIAWERLGERYGKPVNAILSIIRNLRNLELKGKPYEKVEQLAFEVSHSEQMLHELHASDRLRTEVMLVTDLVSKLADHFQHEWWSWSTNQREELTAGVNEWGPFKQWLKNKERHLRTLLTR